MEFKLNKVEMDVRQRINQERSTDKVHSKKQLEVNKDRDAIKEQADEHGKGNAKEQEKKDNDTNVKEQKKDTEQVEERKAEDPYRGHFIDIKR